MGGLKGNRENPEVPNAGSITQRRQNQLGASRYEGIHEIGEKGSNNLFQYLKETGGEDL